MQNRFLSFLLLLISALSISAKPLDFDIRKYGAVADGMTINTVAIQNAIDAASRNKDGGRVIIGRGQWLTGMLEMKSNVGLYLDEGAILLGSTNPYDYDENKKVGKRGDEDVHQGLIVSNGAKNIAITGKGIIDGQGLGLALAIDSLHHIGERIDPSYNTKRQRPTTRPKLLFLADSESITISGVEFRNSSGWGLSFHESADIEISNIKVVNRGYWNNDGIDLNDCKDVYIHDCDINSADDGICLKSDNSSSTCKDITIEHCRITSSASAIKFGTASYGGFCNVSIKDIVVYDTFRSAIALETVDGGRLENITVDGVNATNTGNPLFIRLGARHDEQPGICRNITIRNLKAQVPFGRPDESYDLRGPEVDYFHNPWPSSITGIPGRYIENVTLENIDIEYPGRATKGMAYVGLYRAHEVPEKVDGYPEFSMFGELPSWAFYLRHVKGLSMNNVTVRLAGSDFRPAIVHEDVTDLKIVNSNINESQIHKVERKLSTNERIAFISDPHVTDIVGHPELIRSHALQVQSTRLFNENYYAFCAALDDCGKRGIKLVVLPGDLTDNGQLVNQACVRDILNRYKAQYGMQFFTTVGNHDPARPVTYEDVTRNPLLLGAGYEEQTACYADFGYFPQPQFHYWATPFSSYNADNYSFATAQSESALAKRQYTLTGTPDIYNTPVKAYDASYVVEPVEGLWLLSLDGSVYMPKTAEQLKSTKPDLHTLGDTQYQPSELGYNNILKHRSHLVKWVATVVDEAKRRGKTLITFCHYPLVNVNDNADEFIARSWGDSKFDLKRTPTAEITAAMMNAGLQLHFAGHMHVNDTGIKTDGEQTLTNVQIPSLGVYVPAYKILTIKDSKHLDVQTVVIDDVPGFNTLFPRYKAEYDSDIAAGKTPIWSIETLNAKTYGEFCDWHLRDLTRVRFIPRDVPKVLSEAIVERNGLEILHLINKKAKGVKGMDQWTGFDMLVDLFRLRYAGELSRKDIPESRIAQYDIIFNAARKAKNNAELVEHIRALGGMFHCFLNEEPSVNFTITLK